VRGVRGHRAPRAHGVRGIVSDCHVLGTSVDRTRPEPGICGPRTVRPRFSQNLHRAFRQRRADRLMFDAQVVRQTAAPAYRSPTVRRFRPGQTVGDFHQRAFHNRTG